jgi:hypothetical protein
MVLVFYKKKKIVVILMHFIFIFFAKIRFCFQQINTFHYFFFIEKGEKKRKIKIVFLLLNLPLKPVCECGYSCFSKCFSLGNISK